MAFRPLSLPGSVCLILALVLLIIVTISLPSFSAMDFVRAHSDGDLSRADNNSIKELRFGIWAACSYLASNGDRHCTPKGHGYIAGVSSPTTGEITLIGSSWTRGLAIHPAALIVTFIAAVSSFVAPVIVTLVSTFIATFLTLTAFACDIALLAYVRKRFGEVEGARVKTNTAPAFWLTFVSLILLFVSSGLFLFGRRREGVKTDDGSYSLTSTSFWRRLRRIY